MGFQIAELFVDITLRSASFGRGLKDIKSGLAGLQPGFAWLARASAAVLAGLGGAAAYAVKQFADTDDAQRRLRSSLVATGQFSEDAFQKLIDFTQTIQDITILSDDQMANLLARMVQLGAKVADLRDLGQLGVGLGEMLFGGDAEAGIEAITLAQQGNFRTLQRLVPAIKEAATDQERWAIVLEKARQGMKLAEERSNTLSGVFARLKNQVSDASKAFGQMLVPYVRQAADFVMRLSKFIGALNEEQRVMILRTTAVVAAVAAGIVMLPTMIRLIAGLTQIAGAAATVLMGLGKVIIAVAISPVGIFIAAIGAAITAIAYLVGSGDTMAKRIGNGFVVIAQFMDTLLGSWQGFTTGISMLWQQLAFFIMEAFQDVKNSLMNGWEHLAEFLEQTWWAAFEGMYNAWGFLVTGAQKAMNWIKKGWQDLIDYMAGTFANLWSDKEAEQFVRENAKKGTSEEDLQKEIGQEQERRREHHRKMLDQDRTAREQAYKAKQQALDKERQQDATYMNKQVEAEKNASKAKRQANRDANNKENADNLTNLELARRKEWDEKMAEFKKMPKLSDNIKALVDSLLKSTGYDEFMKKYADLQKEFDKIKGGAEKFGDKAGGPGFKGTGGKLNFTSLQDTFKKQMAIQMIGADLTKRGEAEKREEDARKAREKAQKARERQVSLLESIDSKMDAVGAMA